MKYIPKPRTIEAMQWLGPDNPEHVKAFEAWVRECEPNSKILGCEGPEILISGIDASLVFPMDFAVFDRGQTAVFAPDDFHASYTLAELYDVKGEE